MLKPSRNPWAALLLAGSVVLLSAGQAPAQIVHEKPGQIKAANRRALREVRRTDSPYKESHLAVTPERLKRGGSALPTPEDREELDYSGVAPNVRAAPPRRVKKQ